MFGSPDGLPGRVIGGIRLETVLGSGATGAVSLGRAATAGQARVAIKVLIGFFGSRRACTSLPHHDPWNSMQFILGEEASTFLYQKGQGITASGGG